MKKRFNLAFSVLACAGLLCGACASPNSGGSGGGGSSATGATGGSSATGAGGTTGAGGSSTGIPGLGTGHGFSFPQNKASGSCTLTTVASASNDVQTAYSSWLTTYVQSAGSGKRVVDPQNLSCGGTNVSNGTVSEGMGYGMLAAVYMNDKTTFDGLMTYVMAHLDSKGLMNWCLDSSGNVVAAFSATDGDEDIAWSLLMASDQWSSTSYLTAAQSMINAMWANSVFGDGSLQNGDNFETADVMNTDYFSPAYYRVFDKATNNPAWSTIVISANYTHLMAVTGNDGLVPNSTDLENSLTTSSSCTTCMPSYGYDACRTPWRIAMDYCFNSEPLALAYLQKIGPFFNNIGASNIGDGYSLTGSQTSGNHNMAFIGPAGVAGMAGWQSLLDGAFNFGVSNPGNGNDAYFPQSLRVVTMLMMSGNFLDYTQQ